MATAAGGWASTGGAFSTLLRRRGLRASSDGVLATKSERKMLASTSEYKYKRVHACTRSMPGFTLYLFVYKISSVFLRALFFLGSIGTRIRFGTQNCMPFLAPFSLPTVSSRQRLLHYGRVHGTEMICGRPAYTVHNHSGRSLNLRVDFKRRTFSLDRAVLSAAAVAAASKRAQPEIAATITQIVWQPSPMGGSSGSERGMGWTSNIVNTAGTAAAAAAVAKAACLNGSK